MHVSEATYDSGERPTSKLCLLLYKEKTRQYFNSKLDKIDLRIQEEDVVVQMEITAIDFVHAIQDVPLRFSNKVSL